MDNSFLIIPIFTGPIIIIAGFVLLLFPPKKINGLYGYRTSSAMKSQTHWNFAQNYAAKEMIKIGIFLALTSLVGLFINGSKHLEMYTGLGLMVTAIIVLLIRVESKIKNKFRED